MSSVSFPEVDRIEATRTSQGSRQLEYTVVTSGRPFTNEQLETIRNQLQGAISVKSKANLVLTGTRLSVDVKPADSFAGSGSFEVFNTLQKLLKPKTPLTAIAGMRRMSLPPNISAIMGVRFVGRYSTKTLDELMQRLNELACVSKIEKAPKSWGYDFLLSTKETKQGFTGNDFQAAVKTKGIAVTLFLD